ncbi:SOS response-associated peptidase [Ramlibacter sp. AN1133]|uniref:SOS response-associated peptidase n=1 Tax=Ramlibacter sp. AN1133 TaxID=3133429 RepID=UPI0030BBEF5A
MCNRYRPASVARVRDVFGFTYIESGPPLEERYRTSGIGPLQAGPFIRKGGGLMVGQWGLTPDGSATLKPMNKRTRRPMSTNNARWGKDEPEAWSFKPSWRRGQRCLVPVEDFDEPYWGTRKNIWWRFRRADGQPLMLAGLWNEWTDPETGELLPSFTMLTINCNAHPVLRLMHRPDVDAAGVPLPDEQQDKRTVVPLERSAWQAWLEGSPADAAACIQLPAADLYAHGAADPAKQVLLPIAPVAASAVR